MIFKDEYLYIKLLYTVNMVHINQLQRTLKEKYVKNN